MALQISLNPSRLAVYHAPKPREWWESVGLQKPRSICNKRSENSMSKKAQKRIRNVINWLTYLSGKRDVVTGGGKTIKGFQVSFITLTLPSKQMHTHSEIKKVCLNQFLTECRVKFGVKNYVWKAELQKNGNIHFHITTDRYIHYMQVRNIWNRCIEKLGYITAYQSVYKVMSIEEYAYWQNQNGIYSKARIKKSYQSGVNSNWESPNTTDIKSVKHVKELSSYMAKYLTKEPASKETTGMVADSLEELTGRLWFCSQSLSKLGNVVFELTFKVREVLAILRKLESVRVMEFDWSSLFFFSLGMLPKHLREWLREHLISHAILSGYSFPYSYSVVR